MVKLPPTEKEMREMQEYYDSGFSLRDVQSKFHWSRPALLKYIKTRQPKYISDETKRQRAVNRVYSWRQRTKQKLVELKGGKCKLCGYNKCINNLVFHHKDPSKKEFGISRGLMLGFATMVKETKKCELLCHNCHGEIHAGMVNL